MKLPSTFTLSAPTSIRTSSPLQKRKKPGLPKKDPDSPKSAAPSVKVDKDPPSPTSKPIAAQSADIPKDIPSSVVEPSAASNPDPPKSDAPSFTASKDIPSSTPKPSVAPTTNTGKDNPLRDSNAHESAVSSVEADKDVSKLTSKPSAAPSAVTRRDTTHSVPKPEASPSTSATPTPKPTSGQTDSDPKEIAKTAAEAARSLKLPQGTNLPSRPLADVFPPTVTVTATATPTSLASLGAKKSIGPAEIVAIVFGLVILVLVAAMSFFVRKFYMKYRAERVLREQAQTEGNELKQMNGETMMGGTTVVDRPSRSKWGLRRKESWEK